jgi:hypothetical protein
VKAIRRAERARNPASPSPSVLSSAGLPGPKLAYPVDSSGVTPAGSMSSAASRKCSR